ncbi:MAG TPA: PIN domain-containing protein [Dehalococcoidia bacterium]|nr:PIN domain-containing protein [Dehalococcoidia bacterium]
MTVEFCDTNVLVYAHDMSAGDKRETAVELLSRLWQARAGAISVQVLQELFVTLTRRVLPPIPHGDARAIIVQLSAWLVVAPVASDVLDAIDAVARWQISLWDAMVLTSARKAGAEVLWSEDLSDGQDYDGVVVRNPFAAAQ